MKEAERVGNTAIKPMLDMPQQLVPLFKLG